MSTFSLDSEHNWKPTIDLNKGLIEFIDFVKQKMNNLTIIIPAYRELDNLKVLIPKINKNLSQYFKDFNNNLIIVDGIVPDSLTRRL